MSIFKSIDEVKKLFRNPHQCITHFIKIHHGGIVTCRHCQSQDVSPNSPSPYITSNCYSCNDCSNKFSIFQDTFLDKSNIDLRVWLYAFDQFLDAKSITPYQVQRVLSLPYAKSVKMAEQLNSVLKDPAQLTFARQLLELNYLYEM